MFSFAFSSYALCFQVAFIEAVIHLTKSRSEY